MFHKPTKSSRYLILALVLFLLLLLPLIVLQTEKKQQIQKYAGGSGEINLMLNPSSGSFAKGQTVMVTIQLAQLATRAIRVSGGQAVLSVDARFTINGASCLQPFGGLKVERIEGQTVTLICTINLDGTPVALTSPVPFAALNLTVKNDAVPGAAPVNFTATRVTEADVPNDAPDVSTAGENASYQITEAIISPTPTYVGASPTPTPTPTATNAASVPPNGGTSPTPMVPGVTFMFKMQGVMSQAPDQRVAVTVAGGPQSINQTFPNVTVQSDASGIWQGNLALSGVPEGPGYIILVKGPMHLKRKFCDAVPKPPSERVDYRCGSRGSITLTAGVNELDFTHTIIYIGDLPPQDGEMNARDASEIRLNISKSDTDATSRADVNFDGIVNTTDWSLLIESMQVDFDEEL